MTTRVPIRYGGTGANTAAGARAALGVLANTGGTISGDLTITGNLVVSGNTTTLNTETLMIEDADIVLLSNVTGSPVLNAGITINRGNSTNTFLRWDEGADKWGWSDDGANTYTFDTALSAYSQANAAYGQANAAYSQANAAYTAANNAKVTVFANNSSNVTTQNINFVNTSTVTVTVSADGSNANVAFTAAPQTVVVDTYTASGNTTAAATANIANGLFAIATNAYAQANDANSLANTANNLANSAYAQANSAYTAANNAANTVRVSQNSTSTLSAKQLNFVNTANVTIVVADSGDGNANISFEVASGTGTLSNIGISSNGVFTTNANAFNFVNTSTVSVSVSSGVNGNANIAFNATVAGVNTVIRSETFTSANAAANLTYNILYYPVAVEYVFVNKNGIGLFPTTDYTLSGNTVTIKEAGESGDNIEIRYFVDVSTVPVSNTTIIVEANTVTAQTNTFTLSQNVATINRLSVTKNGLQLTPNTHYTLANGKTVTLTTLAEVDDQIVFRYFFDLGNIQDVGFTAYQQANAAYDQANLAYTAANNRVLKTGDTLTGTLNVQNVIPTTSNTYNLGSSSARFKDLWLSNSTIYLGDASISANAGKIIVPAIETSSGINLESQVASAYGQANSAYTQANSAYGQANSAYTQANSAYSQANAGYTQANSGYTQANSAYTQANSAYGQANAGYTQANSAYTAANTAQTTAQNAYGQANSAYLQANTAYLAANNSNLKSGGVISGTLNVTNDIIVGGNVYLQGNTTFINVATYQVNDSLMYIAANNTLTDSVDIGFVGAKNTSGTFSHTGLARDATDGKYKLFDNLADSGHVGNVIDFANTSLATLVANVEANTLSVVNGVSGNVNFDSGTLFVNSVGNAVGIGTTNPSAKLHINDSGKAIQLDSGNDNSGTGIFFAGSSTATNWFIGNQYNVSNAFEITPTASAGSTTIGTNPALLVMGNGLVGIGTTPTTELHIYKSTGPTINLQAGGSGTKGLRIVKGDSGTAYVTNVDSADLVLGTNNTNRVIITGDGLVGIGTSTIPRRLTIASTATGNYEMIVGAGASVSQNATLDVICTHDNNAFQVWDDNSLTTPKFLVKRSGNVGIGTTNPGELLTVNGSVGLQRSGTQYWHLYVDTNNALNFTRSGVSDRVTISSDGNVGIGTTNPSTNLQVGGTAASGGASGGLGVFLSRGVTTNFYEAFDGTKSFIAGVDNTQTFAKVGTLSNHPVAIVQGNGSAIYIDGSKNVGIGTTSPNMKLEIANLSLGSAINSTKEFMRLYTTTTNNDYLDFFKIRDSDGGTDWTSAGWRIQQKIDNTWMGWMQFNGIGNLGGLALGTGLSAVNPRSVTERVRIDSSGSVGIGTTSPGAKLDVFGGIRSTTSSTTGTAFSEYLNDLGTMVLQIGLFGSAKSGTTFGLNNANLAFMYTTTYTSGHPSALAIGTTSSQPLVFGTGAAERMRIDGSGNVGVNQTSPSYNVHIGKAASGDNHDYGLLVERHGTGASPGSWSSTKAAIAVSDTANAGPASADITGTFYLAFGRMAVSSTNAKNATLTHIGYDSGAESPWRIDGKGNHWVGWNRNVPHTNDGSFCLLVRKGISVGSNYQTTTPPDNGAIIEGNVGIGRSDPQAKLHVQTDDPTFIQITDSGNISTRVGANGSALTFGVDGSNGTTERARIDNSGNLGIGITNPQVKLEVLDEHRIRGTAINRTNIESQSQTKFAGTSGTATLSAPASTETNYIKKFFMMNGTAGTTALNQTLATIDSRNISFHEAWVKITWGTRIQGVTDSTCALNERAFGINKFNGVNNAYTITNSWSHVDGNSDAHMDINVVNSGTGGICLIQYQQSASTGASSFIWGYIEICSCEAMDQSGQVSVSFNC